MSHCVSCSTPIAADRVLCRSGRCRARAARWAAEVPPVFRRADWLLATVAADASELAALLEALAGATIVLRRLGVLATTTGLAGALAALDSDPSLARCCWFSWPAGGTA